ncbi:MAG: hypothetical protein A2Y76_09940 [Planctomycetes bacterium RBG_13_60_9]|nr:MAG: hypothetical protein A2Y76_09940 [Planctomycetes bacterium RBG_13_60_9]
MRTGVWAINEKKSQGFRTFGLGRNDLLLSHKASTEFGSAPGQSSDPLSKMGEGNFVLPLLCVQRVTTADEWPFLRIDYLKPTGQPYRAEVFFLEQEAKEAAFAALKRRFSGEAKLELHTPNRWLHILAAD